jgi:putative transposase
LPRGSRIDAPGTVHHVWSRGIDRRAIFLDDRDRFDLRERMIAIVPDCGTAMPAWAFLDNHFHFVVRTGAVPISTLMRRILTGYGLRFNQRHERTGYVFQGRFGSRIVDGDVDLKTMIRYVHRNPVEAGIVPAIDQLADYRWSGHGALTGRRAPHSFEAVSLALRLFDEDPHEAREMLCAWMRRPEESDPSPDPFDEAVSRVCRELRVSEDDLRNGARDALVSRARTAICQCAVHDLGLKRCDVARRLGISGAAVSYALRR